MTLAGGRNSFIETEGEFFPDVVDLSIGISDGTDESVARARVSVHAGTCAACATVVEEIHAALGERILQAKVSSGHDARAAFTSMNFTEVVVTVCARRADLLMTDAYRETCMHLAKKVHPLLVQAFSGRLCRTRTSH